MHVSAQSTNLTFTVPVSSNRIQRQIQPVLECRSSQHSGQTIGTDTIASADCDTEDEVSYKMIRIICIFYSFVQWANNVDLFRTDICNCNKYDLEYCNSESKTIDLKCNECDNDAKHNTDK